MATKERTYGLSDIGARLPAGWEFEENSITRTYETDGWPTTLQLVNAIGFICEAADHHADLMVSWGRLAVHLSTPRAGGVTDKDLELAREIERLALWRPPDSSALRGTQRKFVQGA
jgi:4a-hydroxytetrahydrobiopterin dehydratase